MGLARHPGVSSDLSTGQTKEKPDDGVLDVVQCASQYEIKKAYQALLKRWHPNKNPDDEKEAEEKSKEIMKAYKALSKSVLPSHGKPKNSVVELKSHVEPCKQSFQESDSSPENHNSSCSEYDESTFESDDELSDSEDHSSLESGEVRESISESGSEADESDSETKNSTPEHNQANPLHGCSKSHESPQTMEKASPSGKKKSPLKKHSRKQEGKRRLEIREKKPLSANSELHIRKKKSHSEFFSENCESYNWKRKIQTKKKVSYTEKPKPHFEGCSIRAGKTGGPEPWGRDDQTHPRKAQRGKSASRIKNKHEKAKGDAHTEGHEAFQVGQNKAHKASELDRQTELQADQKKTQNNVNFSYTRKKISPSKRKEAVGEKPELQPSMNILDNRKATHPQKNEPLAERKPLKTENTKVDVQKRRLPKLREKKLNEMLVEKNNTKPQKVEESARKSKDGKGNRTAPHQKTTATENKLPDYTWKVPATVWLPAGNTAKLLFGGATEFSGDQVTGVDKKPGALNQPLHGNQWANVQAWDRMVHLHPRKTLLLPHIDASVQKGKTWPPSSTNHQAQGHNTEASSSCSGCSQCWCKLFRHGL